MSENTDTLAPPPINFKREYFRMNGKTYRIDNHDNRISIHMRPRHGLFFHDYDVPGDYDWSGCKYGCLMSLSVALVFWITLVLIIRALWRWWNS